MITVFYYGLLFLILLFLILLFLIKFKFTIILKNIKLDITI